MTPSGVTKLGVLTIAVLSAACTRSPGFEKDQSTYDDYTNSYYYRGDDSKTTAERAANMAQPKKRAVILDFWNDTPVAIERGGEFASDELKRDLFLTKKVIVPQEAKTKLSTKDLVDGDRVRVAQLIREGRRLGVSIVVLGRIARVTFRQEGDEIGIFKHKQAYAGADVELKIFDVNAGREIQAVGRTGQADSSTVPLIENETLESPRYRGELAKFAIREAITKLTPIVLQSIEKMSWKGQVAKVQGNQVYLNSGRASGLIGGDILRVLTPGDDIYDPSTGAFLGRSEGQLKGTLEVRDFLGEDSAVATIHSGGQFQVGDVIMLY